MSSYFKSEIASLVSTLANRQILLLEGPLAVGKTTFTQELIGTLGGADVSSPTFTLHQSYETERGSVEHWDLYRLKNDDDLESTGFWDQFEEAKGLILVEWGDRLEANVFPKTWSLTRLLFSLLPDGSRQIQIKKVR